MGNFIDTWSERLIAKAEGIDEQTARDLVSEIYEAATVRAVEVYEATIAQREAEREE